MFPGARRAEPAPQGPASTMAWHGQRKAATGNNVLLGVGQLGDGGMSWEASNEKFRADQARLSADKVGEDSGYMEGEEFTHSYEGQRRSLALPEFAHPREVISKFGDVITQGTPVTIPAQRFPRERALLPNGGVSAPLQSNNPFDSLHTRSSPTHVIVNTGVPGYQGHRPHAAQWGMPHRTRPRLPARPPLPAPLSACVLLRPLLTVTKRINSRPRACAL